MLFIALTGCEKKETPVYSGETITDIDGNVYNTVKIGDQLWMAEDLKVTRYNDGTTIPVITEKTAWSNDITGAYCWYNNVKEWGALYNWYAVSTGRLAPQGWHVASSADWIVLTDFLGGEDVAGGKLKETGGVHWDTPNAEATNDFWFTALPGGLRKMDGSFSFYGGGGYWWTSTIYDNMNSLYHYIFWNGSSVNSGHIARTHGLSVRCVKD